MTILQNDIKVFQSQDNTDNDSGGGSRTSVEIIDGDVNNLFPDISRIDTVSGDVGMRKVFPTVVTINRDIYFGAHAMIRKNPTDPNVSALLFHTDDPHDKRAEAQLKLESYVSASFEEEFYLFGNHIQGSKSVTWLQTTSQTPPVVGEIYMLKEPTLEEQYVRISSIDVQNITLQFNNNGNLTTHTRRRIICEIEQPLDFAFTGSNFDPVGQEPATATTFATQISDAARFYGLKTLDVNASISDQVISVDSIFEQIVPASITQVPIVNQDAVIKGDSLVDTGETLTLPAPNTASGSSTIFPSAIFPNSLTSFQSTTFTDDGKGNLIDGNTSNIIGSVNYKEGVVTLDSIIGGGGGIIVYNPANLVPSTVEFTEGVLISVGNRNLVYVLNVSPLPATTDLYIDYRSNGKWQRITSNGDGTLGQDPSVGAGNVSDNGDGTATISVTLGALPDVDSTIIYSWGSVGRISKHTTLRTVDSNSVNMSEVTAWWIQLDLPDTDIDPLTFIMQLYDDTTNTLVNITADVDGNLIDSADISRIVTGILDYINGVVYITETKSSLRFPDYGTSGKNLIVDYDTFTTIALDPHEIKTNIGSKTPAGGQVTIAENTGTGTITFNIGETINDRASFRLAFGMVVGQTDYWGAGGVTTQDRFIDILMQSKPDGTLYVANYRNDYNQYITGTLATNGDVTLVLGQTRLQELNPAYAGSFGGIPKYLFTLTSFYQLEDRDLSFQYRVDAPLGGVVRVPATTINDVVENLFKYKIQTSGGISGEVYFNFLLQTTNNQTYLFQSKDGNISNEFVPTAGVGTQVGTINYKKGLITLDFYVNPSTMFLDFKPVMTDEINTIEFEAADFTAPVRNVVFRTSSTRLSNSSFQLRFDTVTGTKTATADANGNVTGASVGAGSTVDTVTGMANINFTEDVLASSLRYDAVAESSLPIDPDLLGLNTVRLPIDGRVPVFRDGDHLIIFNEVTTATTNATPLADDVETLARSDQSYIEVIDVNGKRLDPLEYVADKVAGTVTFSNPLALNDKFGNPLTAPFSVVDRIEDMLLVTEVLINGQITLSAPLVHAYTSGISFVASALVWGDTGSRVFNYFAQEIWNNSNPVWQDILDGDPTTSQYDLINFPIQIDNQSSTSGRWAIIFTNSTTVSVVEERLGVIETGISISIDSVAPINPATGLPYFTMDKGGFGGGWVTNNVIRINTDSGDNNMWVIRTVKSGALQENTDNIVLEIRGDGN